MDIEFKGQFDKNQYIRSVMLAYQPSRKSTLLRVALFILFAAIYTGLIIALVQNDEATTWDFSRLLRHGFTLLLLAYFIFQPYLNAYLAANRLWKDPVTRREITGRVSERGVMYDPSTEYIDWDIFIRMKKKPDMVVLLTAEQTFMSLPRSFFSSEPDWTRFQKLADFKVKEAI